MSQASFPLQAPSQTAHMTRTSATTDSSKFSVKGLDFMDLPAEVRHSIYGYLFCHEGSPIWLFSKYRGLKGLTKSEPVFYTQIFRVCRSIYLDAVTFAYSANDFVLKESFPAFCSLGSPALAAIKDLTVIHNAWTAESTAEDLAWNTMRTRCTGLKTLELDLHSDMLLEAVAFLPVFYSALQPGDRRPIIVLDLYVWERHFVFERTDRDHARCLEILQGIHETSASTPRFVHPRDRVMRLPLAPNDIVFSADVNAGAIEALDAFLEMEKSICLSKQPQALPKTGLRACGRSSRFCYIWEDVGGRKQLAGDFARFAG